MDTVGKNFKYKLIPNFLEKDKLSLFVNYCKMRHMNNFDINIDNNDVSKCGTSFYADPLMECLLINKTNDIKKITNKEVFPTYSFWRMYTHLDELKKHKDRKSCEISVSLNLGSSGENWPIYMDGTPLETKPGDAVIYLGREVEHYREKFNGDWYCQVFLHYVDVEGPCKDFKLDKRHTFGRNKNEVYSI